MSFCQRNNSANLIWFDLVSSNSIDEIKDKNREKWSTISFRFLFIYFYYFLFFVISFLIREGKLLLMHEHYWIFTIHIYVYISKRARIHWHFFFAFFSHENCFDLILWRGDLSLVSKWQTIKWHPTNPSSTYLHTYIIQFFLWHMIADSSLIKKKNKRERERKVMR